MFAYLPAVLTLFEIKKLKKTLHFFVLGLSIFVYLDILNVGINLFCICVILSLVINIQLMILVMNIFH